MYYLSCLFERTVVWFLILFSIVYWKFLIEKTFIFTFSNRSWLSDMLGEEVKDRYKELIDETPTWVGCLETLALEVDILARIHVCRVRLVVRSQRTIHPLRPSKTWCLVFSMRNSISVCFFTWLLWLTSSHFLIHGPCTVVSNSWSSAI
jgi:hypothetical protein